MADLETFYYLTWEGNATGGPKIFTVHKTVPFPTLTKSYSAQSVNDAEVENPCVRVNNIRLYITPPKCLSNLLCSSLDKQKKTKILFLKL